LKELGQRGCLSRLLRKDINKAAKALYEKLTPQQRTIADRVLPQGMGMMW
jgi:hypothetical protein